MNKMISTKQVVSHFKLVSHLHDRGNTQLNDCVLWDTNKKVQLHKFLHVVNLYYYFNHIYLYKVLQSFQEGERGRMRVRAPEGAPIDTAARCKLLHPQKPTPFALKNSKKKKYCCLLDDGECT